MVLILQINSMLFSELKPCHISSCKLLFRFLFIYLHRPLNHDIVIVIIYLSYIVIETSETLDFSVIYDDSVVSVSNICILWIRILTGLCRSQNRTSLNQTKLCFPSSQWLARW